MSRHGDLRVGAVAVGRLNDGFSNELLAIFRDDMLHISRVSASVYYRSEYLDYVAEDNGENVEVVEFRAPGRVVAERLDLMGIDATAVLAWMDDQLISRTGILFDKEFLAAADNELRATLERERDFVVSLNAQTWVELLSNASEDSATPARLIPGSRAWLLGQVDYWDERYALRIVLLAFPDAEVVLDITELEENGWQVESKPTSFASNSVAAITGMAVAYAPVVVLTEGRTDAEFLSASVAIL